MLGTEVHVRDEGKRGGFMLHETNLYELYDDMLDDVYGTIQVAGLNYSCSNLLKSTDPVAYRCGFNDWLDFELTEGNIVEQEGGMYVINQR